MATKNYLDKEGLLYYNEKLKAILKANKDDADSKITNLSNTKVDKVEGKGLSTNDFTDELKEKLLHAGDSSFSGNFDDLTSLPKVGTGEGQTTLSSTSILASVADLDAVKIITESNANNFAVLQGQVDNKADKTAVTKEISDAIAGVTSFNYEVVETLPETGVKGTIYLVKYAETPEGDIYKEYIYIDNKFECLGSTNEVDLSGYLKTEDITSINNSEIDAMFTVVSE